MTEPLPDTVERFLEHKRAIGRKYHSEETELRLLVRFAQQRRITRIDRLTPTVLEDFFTSRARCRPRGFNHLVGAVACLMDWAVNQGLLTASPLPDQPRLPPLPVRRHPSASATGRRGRSARQPQGCAARPDLSSPVRALLRARPAGR